MTTVSHERLLAHPVLPNAPGHGYHCPCSAGHTKHQGRLPHCLQDPVGPIDEVELIGVHQVLWVAKLTEDPQKCPTSHQANERIRPRSCKGKQRHQNCDCSETHLGLLGFCGAWMWKLLWFWWSYCSLSISKQDLYESFRPHENPGICPRLYQAPIIQRIQCLSKDMNQQSPKKQNGLSSPSKK